MRKCAKCGLLSPDQSIRCQCGFDFRFDDSRSVRGVHAQWRSTARWTLLAGLLLLVLGAVITAATYATAGARDGRYFIMYGPIIAGLAMVVRALSRLKKIRDIERSD